MQQWLVGAIAGEVFVGWHCCSATKREEVGQTDLGQAELHIWG